MRPPACAILSALFFSSALAAGPCPLLGPSYPSPFDLSSNSSLIPASWENSTSILSAALSSPTNKSGLDVSAHSFSIGLFSAHDALAQDQFQYHHTGASVANFSTNVNKVDADSIYRIGSVSKLLTVYLMLVETAANSSFSWEQPITDFLPELTAPIESKTKASVSNAINTVGWRNVSLGALAGQMAGIQRDTSNAVSELALQIPQDQLIGLGLPALNLASPNDVPICEYSFDSPCSPTGFFTELAQRGPSFAPWTTPVYSNAAFTLLGLALERITGRNFDDMFNDALVNALDLNGTSYIIPTNLSRAVIPGGNASKSFFTAELGNETATGGMFSTLSDLNKIGVSILNSTLLSPQTTRKWMKPVSHTASLTSSVGQPWEILRFTQPATGRINDLYTKAGDVPGYNALLVLSPDHNAGFSILVAGPSATALVGLLSDAIATTVLESLEAQAAKEAVANYAGTYVSSSTSSKGLSTSPANATSTSSLTLALPPSGPGLQITAWQSRGSDLLAGLSQQLDIEDIRVYPTNLVAGSGASKEIAFRAVFTSSAQTGLGGPLSQAQACGSWQSVDSHLYGKKALDELVFQVGEDGRAVSVKSAALRLVLARQ